MTHQAPYDEHADWYAAYVKGEARDHTTRTAEALRELLAPARVAASIWGAARASMQT